MELTRFPKRLWLLCANRGGYDKDNLMYKIFTEVKVAVRRWGGCDGIDIMYKIFNEIKVAVRR